MYLHIIYTVKNEGTLGLKGKPLQSRFRQFKKSEFYNLQFIAWFIYFNQHTSQKFLLFVVYILFIWRLWNSFYKLGLNTVLF
jgi:hypothetical protein